MTTAVLPAAAMVKSYKLFSNIKDSRILADLAREACNPIQPHNCILTVYTVYDDGPDIPIKLGWNFTGFKSLLFHSTLIVPNGGWQRIGYRLAGGVPPPTPTPPEAMVLVGGGGGWVGGGGGWVEKQIDIQTR